MRLMGIVALAAALAQVQNAGLRRGRWPLEGLPVETRANTWIVVKHSPQMTTWLDTARIQQHTADSSMDMRLRYVSAHTTAISDTPGAARFKTVDIEALVRCSDKTLQPSSFVFYDSAGAQMATAHELTPAKGGGGGGGQKAISETLKKLPPLLCNWLTKSHPVASPRR